jgi:hypothetical protein
MRFQNNRVKIRKKFLIPKPSPAFLYFSCKFPAATQMEINFLGFGR